MNHALGMILLVAAVVAATPAVATTAERSSTSATAAVPTQFARVTRDATGRPAALQLAVVSYTAEQDSKEFRVDLVSAIHIGDKAYYQELNDRFRAYDALLYELVIPDDDARPPQKHTNGANLLTGAQIGLKNALGLAFQLDEIDYGPANFVHADLTAGMLEQSMADRGESLYVYFWRLVFASLDEYARDPLGLQDWRLLSGLLSSPQDDALKVALAYKMVEGAKTPDILGGQTGSAVIAARNEHAVRVLNDQFDSGARHVGIFYGVAHMPDFELRLLNEFGLTKAKTEWVDAWRFTAGTNDEAAARCEATECSTAPAQNAATTGPQTPPLERHALTVQGQDRGYALYRPDSLVEPADLVLVLHGSGGGIERIRAFTGRRFESLADADGFLVVYPEGYEGNWNGCRRPAPFSAKQSNVDDVGFIRALVREHGTAGRHAFAFGFGGGGHMALRLVLEAPDTVAAVAAVGASLPVDSDNDCRTVARAATPAVLLINGTADPVNPYGGGDVVLPEALGGLQLGRVLSSDETAAYFATLAGHGGAPSKQRGPEADGDPDTAIIRSRWNAPELASVELVTVENGGHTIPQSGTRFPDLAGPHTADIDAPLEAWKFFRDSVTK